MIAYLADNRVVAPRAVPPSVLTLGIEPEVEVLRDLVLTTKLHQIMLHKLLRSTGGIRTYILCGLSDP